MPSALVHGNRLNDLAFSGPLMPPGGQLQTHLPPNAVRPTPRQRNLQLVDVHTAFHLAPNRGPMPFCSLPMSAQHSGPNPGNRLQLSPGFGKEDSTKPPGLPSRGSPCAQRALWRALSLFSWLIFPNRHGSVLSAHKAKAFKCSLWSLWPGWVQSLPWAFCSAAV